MSWCQAGAGYRDGAGAAPVYFRSLLRLAPAQTGGSGAACESGDCRGDGKMESLRQKRQKQVGESVVIVEVGCHQRAAAASQLAPDGRC